MPKLHQAWPGTNRFYCGGITGPTKDFFANIFYYICLLIILIPYSVFMFGQIWKISPAIPLLLLLSIILTTVFLNLTSFTDPGIIPRRPFLEAQYEKYEIYLRYAIVTEGSIDKRKFCETCRIFRPPRASHCSSCGNCVQVFDHHCPFVNNCIGKRNYRFFIMFLASVMLSIGAVIVNFVIYGLTRLESTNIDSTIVIIICSIAVGVIFVPLLGFFIFHVYLTITRTTTRQLIKRIKSEQLQQKTVHQNQWCAVDPPLIDYYQQISEAQLVNLKLKLDNLHNSIHVPEINPEVSISNPNENN